MSHNLTDKQFHTLAWIVSQIRSGALQEEFAFYWTFDGCVISGFNGNDDDVPEINRGILDALSAEGFIRCSPTHRTSTSGQISEASRSCVITKKALELSDFQPKGITGGLTRIRRLMPLASINILAWIAGIVGAVIAGLIIYYLTA